SAMLALNVFEAGGGKGHRFIPGDFPPGFVNGIANHRAGDAIFVGGVTKGKTAFDTGVTPIGLAILPGCHAHHRAAFKFGLKATANTAIGAGGNNAVLRYTLVNNTVFGKGGGGAN